MIPAMHCVLIIIECECMEWLYACQPQVSPGTFFPTRLFIAGMERAAESWGLHPFKPVWCLADLSCLSGSRAFMGLRSYLVGYMLGAGNDFESSATVIGFDSMKLVRRLVSELVFLALLFKNEFFFFLKVFILLLLYWKGACSVCLWWRKMERSVFMEIKWNIVFVLLKSRNFLILSSFPFFLFFFFFLFLMIFFNEVNLTFKKRVRLPVELAWTAFCYVELLEGGPGKFWLIRKGSKIVLLIF